MNTLQDAARTWSFAGWHAALSPDVVALSSPFGNRTWSELDSEINAVALAYRRAGLSPGDSVAVLLPNCAEFAIAIIAALHAGLRVTPVNWHLGLAETAYIIENCEAKALLAHAHFSASAENAGQSPLLKLKVVVGGDIANFESYQSVIQQSSGRLSDPEPGRIMLYTSGTTGNPKGVLRKEPTILDTDMYTAKYDYRPGDVRLACGPAYHAAPLLFDVLVPLACGVPVVMRDRFDAEDVLRVIEAKKITHMHLVPAMFERMIGLPEQTKSRYDVSSVREINHGAAPCAIKTKRAMIEWFGPVLLEYYAASEGGVGIEITSREWLEKPGSVGRVPGLDAFRVLNDDNELVPSGVSGKLYMAAPPENPFVYYKAPEKTNESFIGNFFWLGDIGYVDDDGYLFLTGRSAECIISGGVNIYPSEIDAVLIGHPAIHDVCTVGIPDDRETGNMGELVHAVISLNSGFQYSDNLVEEIINFAQENLSKFKCPQSISVVDEVPRLPSGKIVRARVREPFWAGREKSI